MIRAILPSIVVLMTLSTTVSFSSVYVDIIINFKIKSTLDDVVTIQSRSELDCACRCFTNNQCCLASYHRTEETGECHLDLSPLCELRIVPDAEWITMVKTDAQHPANAESPTPSLSPTTDRVMGKPKDCAEIPMSESGVHTIYPTGTNGISVYCEYTDPLWGPWTVIQSRIDASVDFYRSWSEYKIGFGDVVGNYWIGNDNICLLTAQDSYILEVYLEDWENCTASARYYVFNVGCESTNYTLTVDSFDDVGNAGDSFLVHNGHQFSTYDRDNDALNGMNCAEMSEGGWWYYSCQHTNLNGPYKQGQYPAGTGKVISWLTFHNLDYSLKSCSMRISRAPNQP